MIVDWYGSAELYVVDINGKTKFGITSNWSQRERYYRKEFGNVQIKKYRAYPFKHFWEAELIEQLMKWRLRNFVIPGTHEWLKPDFQMIVAIDCYDTTIAVIQKEMGDHENIHKSGNDRWGHYKQLAAILFNDEL